MIHLDEESVLFRQRPPDGLEIWNRMSAYRCKAFDVHDQKMIQTAKKTGQPEHVARAIDVAVSGLKARLLHARDTFRIIDGKPHLLLPSTVQGNYFDQYIVHLTLQELAADMGRDIVVIYDGPKQKTNKPVSPDVKFDPSGQ
jgi:hypothetical protein